MIPYVNINFYRAHNEEIHRALQQAQPKFRKTLRNSATAGFLAEGEDLRSAGAWRPSSVDDGTPGYADPGIAEGGLQLPGDLNQDGSMDISDSIALLGHLFLGSPARLPCQEGTIDDPANISLLDVNGDNSLNLTDAIHSLAYLFMGGAPPVPGTECMPIPGCPDACAGEGL